MPHVRLSSATVVACSIASARASLRWSRPVGRVCGWNKLGSGCRQAATPALSGRTPRPSCWTRAKTAPRPLRRAPLGGCHVAAPSARLIALKLTPLSPYDGTVQALSQVACRATGCRWVALARAAAVPPMAPRWAAPRIACTATPLAAQPGRRCHLLPPAKATKLARSSCYPKSGLSIRSRTTRVGREPGCAVRSALCPRRSGGSPG